MTDTAEKLIWWIEERYDVYARKEMGLDKPWSKDPTFQTTYFCNVHRENDRVTKWIRNNFPLDHPMPVFNMMVARLINKPTSLENMGWPFSNWGGYQRDRFRAVMSQKGAWGGAYIVSTNGRSMPKHEYISGLLDAAQGGFGGVGKAHTCLAAHNALQAIMGLASFMSAQIVADLKNTKGHRLAEAPDWWTFVAPGPGSLRGMAWVLEEDRVTPTFFHEGIYWLRQYVDENLHSVDVPKFCNQDLQNCLCEFDKYMRVSTGAGRSKRKYNGS